MGYVESCMRWYVTEKEQERLCREADKPRVLTVVTIRRSNR